jgi:S1-C subfamily serine protease
MIKVNGGEGTGSGFIVAGGYIVTDNHVVTLDGQVRAASLRVVFDGGRKMNARLVGRDPFSDIAVIKPDHGTSLPALTLGNSDSVEVGDPVIAIGSPLGLAGTVTSGIISALHRPVQAGAGPGTAPQVFYDAIQTDAPINPGNSGGPLVNGQGQVIGVDAAIDTLGSNPVTGTQGGSIGLGFAIPINQVRIVAAELIRTGHAAHAIIGALINVDYHGTGAQILTSRARHARPIAPGGPAARAGLRPGDVITRFGGQPVASANALLDAIRSRQPGTRVSVTFTRNGVTHTVMLTLGSATS